MAQELAIRIRIAGDQGRLTIKEITRYAARHEYEYSVPHGDARDIPDTPCHRPLIEKYRYRTGYHGTTRKVDEFVGENAGLVIAEIERPIRYSPSTGRAGSVRR